MDTPAVKDMTITIPKMVIIAPVGISLLSLPTLKSAPSESMPSSDNNDLEGSDVGEVDMVCVNGDFDGDNDGNLLGMDVSVMIDEILGEEEGEIVGCAVIGDSLGDID